MYRLKLQNNLSEVISYDDPAFMIRSYRGGLEEYINSTVPAHWHSEIEFIYINEGAAVYHVNTQSFRMSPGDVIFINSNRLHYGYSPDHSNFIYSIVQFSPDFVENRSIRQNYLNRIIGDAGLDAVYLSGNTEQNRELISTLKEIISLNIGKPEDYQLSVTALFYILLKSMMQLSHFSGAEADPGSPIPALQNMLTYIQDHYAEPIHLTDIASAGAMCRSKCCALFHRVLQQSPMEFTKNFRIRKSVRLLIDTEMTISEIAETCGFCKSSYFVECFHAEVGYTPKKYRSLLRDENK